MTILILGLLLFLGMHSVRIAAAGARERFIAARGASAWKGLYTVVSLVGLGLIIWGYGAARADPVALWTPLPWARHLASPLTLLAFVLLAAAHVPRNHLKATVQHPMLLGVATWALAHLLANHTLADLLLFGGFLAWATVAFRALRQRDRAAGAVYPAGGWRGTALTLASGGAAWAGFALWAHQAWIGVRPF